MADNVLDDAAPAPTDLPDDSALPVESAVPAPDDAESSADAGPSARKDRSRLYVIVGAIAVLLVVIGGVAVSKLTGEEEVSNEQAFAEMPGKQAPKLYATPAGAQVGSTPFDFKGFLAEDGSPALVVFFANWHQISQAALPEAQRISDEAQGRYRVLAVATMVNAQPAKAGWESPEAAVATAGLTAPLVRDDSEANFGNWHILDLPQVYVVSPNGKVLLAKSGENSLAEAEKYLDSRK